MVLSLSPKAYATIILMLSTSEAGWFGFGQPHQHSLWVFLYAAVMVNDLHRLLPMIQVSIGLLHDG